ncbi:hypothetical protein [Streptomyces sp. NPDC059010]|uniref:hypothetical protein n=1 Tax=Streptomyces sp. NPDC059010 TaxID=3346695 RepID=UPI0036777A10
MRLRPALRRTRVFALAAGLAAAGALTLTPPASAAAQADVTATLRVTITDGISGATVETDGQVIDFTL